MAATSVVKGKQHQHQHHTTTSTTSSAPQLKGDGNGMIKSKTLSPSTSTPPLSAVPPSSPSSSLAMLSSPTGTATTSTITTEMRRRSIGATPTPTQGASSSSSSSPYASYPTATSSPPVASSSSSALAATTTHLPPQQQQQQQQHMHFVNQHQLQLQQQQQHHDQLYRHQQQHQQQHGFTAFGMQHQPISPIPLLGSIPLPTTSSSSANSSSNSSSHGGGLGAGIGIGVDGRSSSSSSGSGFPTLINNTTGVSPSAHASTSASASGRSHTADWPHQQNHSNTNKFAPSQSTNTANVNRQYSHSQQFHNHHHHVPHQQHPSASNSNMPNYIGSPSQAQYNGGGSAGGGNNNNNNNNMNHPTSSSSTSSGIRLPRPSETFTRELSNVLLHTFVPSVLPTPEEYQVKESARKYLEYLADRVTPGAKLLPFGSQANGMALRNSDMDLCYISPPGKPRRMPSELVELLGRMIEVEAPVFAVQMLSRARIPIIKLSPSPIYHLRRQEAQQQQVASSSSSSKPQNSKAAVASTSSASSSAAPASTSTSIKADDDSSKTTIGNTPKSQSTNAASPTGDATTSQAASASASASAPAGQTPTPPPMPEYGLSCDIGFENRLALENTRLVLTYAMTDPRLRTIVLFLKVWTKRRKINNPYLGTLSSYGYVLLVIHFLINVRKPAVLPNLQRLRPMANMSATRSEFEGRDIYFFDDLDVLPRYWQSTNRDNVGELLIAFFHYFHKEFRYAFDAISIRSEGGIVSKASKGWMADQPVDGDAPSKDAPTTNRNAPRDLNRLCIEDPFQTDYNVARTVTVDGLFTIRGEIARATGILRGTRSDVNAVIAELLEEREDYLVQAPPPSSTNRRRSAPSPRLQPSLMATHNDFRNWALANGVPHAQGGNIPLLPNQLHGNPLSDDLGGQTNGLSAANIEALARYQQASQALSQANLQQQQAQQQQQQQQLVNNIPALLASTGVRNPRSAGGPRRFHEHSYRPTRQQGGYYTAQQQQQQSLLAQQLYASQQQQQMFQNQLSTMTAQMLHPNNNNSLSPRSAEPANASGTSRGPRLDRRSSWDGSAASDDNRQPYRGSSSASEAAVGDLGTTTAPTSPAMHNGNLPAFVGRTNYQSGPGPASTASPTLSTMSISTAPAASYGQYGGSVSHHDRQSRDYRGPRNNNGSYARSPSHTSGPSSYVRPPRHSRDDYGGMSIGMSLPMQPFPTSFPPGHQSIADLAGMPLGQQGPGRGNRHISNSSAVSLTSADASLANSPQVNIPSSAIDDRDPIVQSDSSSPIPSPNSIRFGNFDAALYSSEPAEMAGLGLFETLSSSESSPTGLPEAAARLEIASIPDELPLPPPIRLPPQPSPNFVAAVKNAQRFRPQLADIPASPAGKNPVQQTRVELGRRPSLQNGRRRSAGDEAALGLKDVTFFGNIPVNKSPNEREKAMAALLKESGRDSKAAGSSASSQTNSFVNDSSATEGTSDS